MTAVALDREQARLALQTELDASKTQAERNSLGQFATPTALATEILTCARTLLGPTQAAFLDPAIGTGSFYSALLRTFPPSSIERAEGYEIDPHYAEPARALWDGSGLRLHVGDFTRATPGGRFNLLVSNPPYVRHHHISIDEKLRLQRVVFDATGIRLGGLSGLYCYFMCLSSAWLSDGGIAAWLVPSEFMDVNYGRQVKDYLLSNVTLLRIHRFDPNEVQFGDALVSSALVWFRNTPPPAEHRVEFTYGGTLHAPRLTRTVAGSELAAAAKWTGLVERNGSAREVGPTFSDLFTVRRGVATGDNNYFILGDAQVAEHDLPMDVLRPILPGPRYLPVDEVPADDRGLPVLDRRLFLLYCSLPEDEVLRRYPALHRYLARGRAAGIHDGYLCTHRSPWYAQEPREPSPFLCTYMGRSNTGTARPFRFILNHSRAIAANVYLMLYPRPVLARALAADHAAARRVWIVLNQFRPEVLTGEGRVYGGGLHKLEPKELGNVPAADVLAAAGITVKRAERQMALL